MPYSTCSFRDSVWCKIGTLLIGVYYRSTNSAILGTDNNDKLCELITDVSGDDVLVMADINFPEINWISNTLNTPASTKCNFLSQWRKLPYTNILQLTRGQSVLDLIFTRDPDLVSDI